MPNTPPAPVHASLGDSLAAVDAVAPPPPVFWPDIDVYFKRDLSLALRMVDTLHEMGVRVIKTAALHDANVCLPGSAEVQYHVPGRGPVSEPYRAVIDRHALPMPDLRRLCERVRQRGLDLVLSVYDPEGIALAQAFDAAAIKIPSSNIVHAPLIRAAAACAPLLVLDTGRSTLNEIDRAVHWARSAGARRLLIQHSPPGPPAPVGEQRLSVMPALGLRHGAAFGLSDHFPGLDMVALAVALGAQVIEKGVCPDGATADIDLAHALPLAHVPQALQIIAHAHQAVGVADLSDRIGRARSPDRMGLVVARSLYPGDRIDAGSVRFAFPTVGIPVEDWDQVQARAVRAYLEPGEPLQLHHLAPP